MYLASESTWVHVAITHLVTGKKKKKFFDPFITCSNDLVET